VKTSNPTIKGEDQYCFEGKHKYKYPKTERSGKYLSIRGIKENTNFEYYIT
jgi:hypothetical protein